MQSIWTELEPAVCTVEADSRKLSEVTVSYLAAADHMERQLT